MPTLRDVIAGPWRAVLVLGVTEILAWGTIFYPPVLTVPLIAHDRGWSMSLAMGGFSLALLTAGLVSPRVGLLIDHYGGHRVMSVGSLLAALGLASIVYADHPAAYIAVWMVLGVAIAATLYDPAFATLGRIFGAGARRPITAHQENHFRSQLERRSDRGSGLHRSAPVRAACRRSLAV
jgi:MFS family permease